MKILFSALGKTDPVRGLRDGAMLHIVRHYKPERVILFISAEMKQLDDIDNRYALAFEALRDVCGLEPELIRIELPDVDPSEFDAFDRLFRSRLQSEAEMYPKAELLLNLSSGTPQMKNAWMLISLEQRWRTRAIQVKSPEKRANAADPTTQRGYDVSLEIELNEDNAPDAPNRCSEPRFFALKRSIVNRQIHALIDRYDYDAAVQLMELNSTAEGELPEDDRSAVALLSYAAARQELYKGKVRLMEAKLPDALRRKLDWRPSPPFDRLYEFQLLMRNLAESRHYSEFAMRMNPYVIELEIEFLARRLGLPQADYLRRDSDGNLHIDSNKFAKRQPEPAAWLDGRLRYGLRDDNISQYILILLIQHMLAASDAQSVLRPYADFFCKCELFNKKVRNPLAHQLETVDEGKFKQELGIEAFEASEMFERILALLCDELTAEKFTTFNPYRRINQTVKLLLALN